LGGSERTTIILCEPQCWGFEHAPFNAALLRTVLLAFPEARVAFMGEKEHLTCVRNLPPGNGRVEDPRVEWREITIPPRAQSGRGRLYRELSLCRRVLSAASRPEVRAIVICSMTKPGLFALKTLLPWGGIRVPVLAVLHSVLADLDPALPARPRKLSLTLRQVLKLAHPRQLAYLALGASIYRCLAETVPEVIPYFKVLDHPYFMLPAESPSDLPGPVRFGYFGTGNSATKGFRQFARLAQETLRTRSPRDAEFLLVGSLQREESGRVGDSESVQGLSYEPLPNDEYARRASSVTYAVGLGSPSYYRLVASASFLDALCFAKPGIYLRNPFIEHYFDSLGDIGYLCDSCDAVRDTVFSVLGEFPLSTYRQQGLNILRGRQRFEPNALAPQFRAVVNACEDQSKG